MYGVILCAVNKIKLAREKINSVLSTFRHLTFLCDNSETKNYNVEVKYPLLDKNQ